MRKEAVKRFVEEFTAEQEREDRPIRHLVNAAGVF